MGREPRPASSSNSSRWRWSRRPGPVYTFDPGPPTVIDKFNASGVPQNFSSTGTSSLNVTSACPGFSIYQYGEEEIAVDSSGTANQGNIYVAAYNGGGVCAFNSAGELLWHMTPAEDPSSAAPAP